MTRRTIGVALLGNGWGQDFHTGAYSPIPMRSSSWVCATVGTRYAGGRDTVDDDGILLIEWSNGTNSLVECGWWQPHIGGLESDTEIYGTKGYARIWSPEPPPASYEHGSQPCTRLS